MKEKIIITSDHAGYKLKEVVKEHLLKKGFEVSDMSKSSELEKVSYAKQGKLLAKKVLEDTKSIGIGVCGTGIGISVAVNRFSGIRGARVTTVEDAQLAKLHNNANILLLGGRQLESEKAIEMVEAFLKTEYEGGRHQSRIDELDSE